MSERLRCILLTRPDSTVLQVCKVRPLVLQLDWSAPPYLLCPFPRFSPSGRPRSVVSQSALASRSEKSYKQRFDVLLVGEASQSRRQASSLLGQAFRLERRAGVRSERRPFSARPFGRRGGLESEAIWPGFLVGEVAWSQRQAPVLLGQAFQSERWAEVRSECCSS